MIDAFVDLMDGLFWEGYANQLATDNPNQFNVELNDFLNNYGGC